MVIPERQGARKSKTKNGQLASLASNPWSLSPFLNSGQNGLNSNTSANQLLLLLCHLWPGLLQGVSVSVSVLTLTAISLERYYAIVHPLRLRGTLSRTRFTILAIWVISAVLMVPELVVLDTHRNLPARINSDLLTTCKPGWSYKQQAAYQIFLLTAVYLVPLFVMSIAYLRIGLTLWRGPVPAEQSAVYDAGEQRTLLAIIIVLGLVVVLVVVTRILAIIKWVTWPWPRPPAPFRDLLSPMGYDLPWSSYLPTCKFFSSTGCKERRRKM